MAVPDAHNPPDLNETLEIVNKARAMLSPEEISKLNNTTGEIFQQLKLHYTRLGYVRLGSVSLV